MIFQSTRLAVGIFSLIFIILLAAIVFGIYDIRSKNQETSILLNDARQVTEVGGLTQSIKTIRASLSEDSLALDELAFTSEKLVPFIESIEEKGESLKLDTSITSVEKKEGADPADPGLINLVVETTGSWASNSAFLHAIESLPYRVMIKESTLSRNQDAWHLRVLFSIHSFD